MRYQPPEGSDPGAPASAPRDSQPPIYQPGYGSQPGVAYPPPAAPSQPLYPPPPAYPVGYQPQPYQPYPPGYGQPPYPPPPAAPSQPLYPPPPGYGPQAPPMGYGAPGYTARPEQGSGLAIAGLILGGISLVFAFFAPCSFTFGLLGLIFSVLGRQSVSRRTVATLGLVLSIIGLSASVLMVLNFFLSLRQ